MKLISKLFLITIFAFAVACGGGQGETSENGDTVEATEEKIDEATKKVIEEVEKASQEVKEEAENVEDEVNKLLEDI